MLSLRSLLACLLTLCALALARRAQASDPTLPRPLGPDGGWVTALAASPSFGQDGRAWAGVFGGRIFATRDGATSWAESHAGETDPVVAGITASPDFSHGGMVFAAADDGVFRSPDGGATWARASAGLGAHFCRALVLSPSFGSDPTAYVATDAGVYRSTDGGTSWVAPDSGGHSAVSLILIPGAAGSSVLYAGLDGGGLDTSTDAGRTWQRVNGFPSGRRVLALTASHGPGGDGVIAATDDGIWLGDSAGSAWARVAAAGDRIDALAAGLPGEVFAGSGAGNGVYRTADGGRNWSRVGAPDLPFVTSLAVAGTAGGEDVLAGTAGKGVFTSSDRGAHWNPASAGLHGTQIVGLASVPGGLVTGGNGGAEMSIDGSSWRPLAVGSPFVTALSGSGDDLFVGTQDRGLLHSSDGGLTWRAPALGSGSVGAVAASPALASDRTVLAASDYVYRSGDGGATFERSIGMAGNDVRSFAFSPAFGHDGMAFAGTVSHGLYRTSDGGVSWQLSDAGLPTASITAILPSPRFDADRSVYAATAGDGVFVSSDAGVTWSPLVPAVPNLTIGALAWSRSGSLLAGTERGIFAEGPAGWSHLGGSWDGYVTALADVAAGGSETLFAGTVGQGVWALDLSPAGPTATATPAGTATPPPLPSSTPTPSASPTPRAGTSPTPGPTPAPAPRPLHIHVSVLPLPPVSGRPAILLIRGPGGGSLIAHLAARGWQRTFATPLGHDGRLALGFVAPASPFTVSVDVTGRGQLAHVSLAVGVRSP